jgi:hypothetical protein
VELIHMGGRVYDYNLGRFLNVDPIIGNPMHSQSMNPYSYLGNNPLSGSDPTGYLGCANINMQQKNAAGHCDDVDKSGNTVQKSYAFNDKGDFALGAGGHLADVGGAIGFGVGILRNGADSQTTSGPQSAPIGNDASSIGSRVASFVAPNIVALGERGTPGTFGSNTVGFGKSVLNGVIGLANLAIVSQNPFAAYEGGLVPHVNIGDDQLVGAAWGDAANTLLGPAILRGIGRLGGIAATALDETTLLRQHTESAIERFNLEGFTPAQQRALISRPEMAPAYRGDRIDTFIKESVSADPLLQHLQVTPRFKFGPDIFDAATGRWWDVTTPGQWSRHVEKYTPSFGSGTPLFTQ